MKPCVRNCGCCLPLRLGAAVVALLYMVFHVALVWPYVRFMRLASDRPAGLSAPQMYGLLFNVGLAHDCLALALNTLLLLAAAHRWRWACGCWLGLQMPLDVLLLVRLALVAKFEAEIGSERLFFFSLIVAIFWTFFMVYSYIVVASFYLHMGEQQRAAKAPRRRRGQAAAGDQD